VRPDGTRGPGLFAYLRSLVGRDGGDRRDVIATVFKGTINRMINGYLLRDVINKVAGIHFGSSEELHTLGALYESMLREMRDAAGDSGEFYTPRPVVRFMVTVINPRLGETILDPACGTGGFLVEAFSNLQKQCKTVEDRETLQTRSIFGGEAKPLPYLLAQMNLLLHGLESPQIDPGNSLAVRISEIGDRDRVDIILTNPPFGGEEERGILTNFPSDKQTTETALLFLQLIMRKVRRAPKQGRAAVVVPNGTLYATGVAERIRTDLLRNFNLHTVVRLPKGVFEPYADIPTNLLFFDTSGSTSGIWFYEHPLPANRAALRSPCYSQSEPLVFEEFLPLMKWWTKRIPTKHAWFVDKGVIERGDYNLDLKNPNALGRELIDLGARSTRAKRASDQVGESISALAELANSVETLAPSVRAVRWTTARMGDVCSIIKGKFPTMKTAPGPYPFVVTAAVRRTADSYQFDGAAVCIPLVSSTGHGHAALHRIHFQAGKFAVANIMAAVVVRNEQTLLPKFLYYYLWRHKDEKLVTLMAGTANTSLNLTDLGDVPVEFPDLRMQSEIVAELDRMDFARGHICANAEIALEESRELFVDALHSLF
jgi:type I restriction enzyme M protein